MNVNSIVSGGKQSVKDLESIGKKGLSKNPLKATGQLLKPAASLVKGLLGGVI